MPKEVIKEYNDSGADIEVRWGKDHFDIIQVIIDRKSEFRFLHENPEEPDPDNNGGVYTGLAIHLQNKEDVERLIKALRRAARKTF